MKKFTKKEFQQFSLKKRYELLRKEGEYIGARIHGSHRVHLYSLRGYFVELWIILLLNEVQWIEIQENQRILNEYVKDINIHHELDF